MFPEENDRDRYIITYADLITLLLGLFIILYASSNIDVAKYQKMMTAMGSFFGNDYKTKPAGFLKENLNGSNAISLKDKVNSLVNKYNLSAAVKISSTERGVVVRIHDDILFNSGSSELGNYSKIILSNVAKVLKELPNDVRIEGHTDNIPISTSSILSNWHLSVSRATNTAFYLMMNEGLPQDRVTIVGYAEYKPVDSNETPQGRSNNRRVDIVILN
ncbi:MAG: OmpA family protein [Ignavibacteriales bacterium]|nr:OmpA family protein [Ignavibacteriales bacterium]